jgi:hypothetical protein
MLNTEISPDVAALVDVLQATSPGQTATYLTLSEAIGRDVRACRYLITSARRIAAREHGAVFANEMLKGYTRLTTEQLSGVGATARARVRRTSRTASRYIRQGADRANDVEPTAQRRINAELSVLGLIEHVASDKIAAPSPAHDTHPEPVAIVARRLFNGSQQ